jgi:hypothetical protein
MVANLMRILTLALGLRLPTVFSTRDFVRGGGFMSYGPSYTERFRRAADYVDKILPRRQAQRYTSRAANEVRTRCQYDHRAGTRARRAGDVARSRRRGYRVVGGFNVAASAHVGSWHGSEVRTPARYVCYQRTNRTVTGRGEIDTLDPKPTSAGSKSRTAASPMTDRRRSVILFPTPWDSECNSID